MKKFKTIVNEKIVCITISVLLFIPNILGVFSKNAAPESFTGQGVSEHFQPELVSRISTVDDLLAEADFIADSLRVDVKTLAYAEVLTHLVKNRFYHGYSHYAIHENWVAVLFGAYVWDHLSAIVIPDDILKYPMAACSQQSIVLAEGFKRKGLQYRKVGFDHHFALESKIDDQWYYFDPNLEPDFSAVQRKSLQSLVDEEALYQIYQNKLDSSKLDWALSGVYFGATDESLAPRASFFHMVTKSLSIGGFLLPLLFLMIRIKVKSE